MIGGGGSILTVPVLVYLFGINPLLATAYSLFVVGVTSLVGTISKFRQGLVDLRTAVVFAPPSLVAVYLTRLYILPGLPQQITVANLQASKDLVILVFFAFIMLAAAISMIWTRKEFKESRKLNYVKIILDGLVVGVLTGIVGAGGGFLIIPALVLLAGLPMKLAVGTSLLIIAVKSLIGFLGDVQSGQEIDWSFLIFFTSLAVVGIFAGNHFSKHIPDQKLKRFFGWFVLIMSLTILLKEIAFS